jgi:nucleoside-diphosphate-sugar epimerase
VDKIRTNIRKDCLAAASEYGDIISMLSNEKISITGGTGFLGSWIAEMIIVLNTEFDANIVLDIFARDINTWQKKYPHFSSCEYINCISHDIRSPITFSSDTAFIIHAAGSPSSRVHASDPLGAVKTILGVENALQAAAKLSDLKRFVNISSCFVVGKNNKNDVGTKESDCFPIKPGALDSAYCEAKRTAETLCSIYRSSFRLPISTIRPFTFTGPYQSLQNPWAINNFMNDIINGNDIRIHGDGGAKRSYLYGSDVAFWVLTSLVRGIDGGIYNLGGSCPITHNNLANLLREISPNMVNLRHNTLFTGDRQHDNLYPDMNHTMVSLGVKESCSIEESITKTLHWFLNK